MKIALTIVAALLLSGCHAIQRAQVQAQQTELRTQEKQWMDQFRAEAQAIRNQCEAAMTAAGLSSIETKVQLLRPAGNETTPVIFLSNESYPTDLEKGEILRWATVRDDCNAKYQAWRKMKGNPPAISADVWARLGSFGAQATELANELIVGLYEGKITYGEFARRRQQIGVDAQTAERDYAAAVDQANFQRNLQAETVAEQHYQTQVLEQQNWIRLMKIGTEAAQRGAGGAPGTRIMCTNNSMASGTMPNPTICQTF